MSIVQVLRLPSAVSLDVQCNATLQASEVVYTENWVTSTLPFLLTQAAFS